MEMDQFFFYFLGLALICFDPLLSVDVPLGAAALPSFVWLRPTLGSARCAVVWLLGPVVAGWCHLPCGSRLI